MASWLVRNAILDRFKRGSIYTTRCLRAFTQSATVKAGNKPLPPRRKILDSEIEESFLKGTGPGGQKINKTNSAVQIKHLPTGLVVKCQGTRSRDQNRKDARRLLADKLEEMELGEDSRTRIKEKEQARKKASKRKKSLRKYRAIAEGKNGEDGKEEGDEGEEKDGEQDDNTAEEARERDKEEADKTRSSDQAVEKESTGANK